MKPYILYFFPFSFHIASSSNIKVFNPRNNYLDHINNKCYCNALYNYITDNCFTTLLGTNDLLSDMQYDINKDLVVN